jgi:tetratricopeptide (TPR) repeat protein
MITGYPTIVITKPDGQEIDRIWGYMGPTEFYNQVQLFLQGKETLDDYLTRIADEPDNPEYLMIIGQKYASRGETHKAIEFYSRLSQLDGDNRRGYHAKALAAISDAQSRSKDYKSAIETSKEIISRFPTAPEADAAAAMLGYYTAQTGDEAGALALYREYLNKYPNGQRDWVQKRIADLEEKSKP